MRIIPKRFIFLLTILIHNVYDVIHILLSKVGKLMKVKLSPLNKRSLSCE